MNLRLRSNHRARIAGRRSRDRERTERAFDWELARARIAHARAALNQQGDDAPEVLERAWAQRAERLAAEPAGAEAGAQLDLVMLRLGREIYAIDAQQVSDIRPAGQITRLPRAPQWVAGMVNVRGKILSAVDLQRFFGLARDEEEGPRRRHLLTVQAADMEVALLVDEVLAVQALQTDQVQAAGDTARGLQPEYVRGIAQVRLAEEGENKMVVVLCLPAVLADPRLIVHEEIL